MTCYPNDTLSEWHAILFSNIKDNACSWMRICVWNGYYINFCVMTAFHRCRWKFWGMCQNPLTVMKTVQSWASTTIWACQKYAGSPYLYSQQTTWHGVFCSNGIQRKEEKWQWKLSSQCWTNVTGTTLLRTYRKWFLPVRVRYVLKNIPNQLLLVAPCKSHCASVCTMKLFLDFAVYCFPLFCIWCTSVGEPDSPSSHLVLFWRNLKSDQRQNISVTYKTFM